MLKKIRTWKTEVTFPVIVVIVGVLLAVYHLFSYMIPFTDNAFIATNVTPIAADVSGYITKMYVHNGQAVKKNAPLFDVYRLPYRLAYQKAKARYHEALEHIKLIQRQTEKTLSLLRAAQFDWEKASYEYRLKSASRVSEAVPIIEIKKLHYDMQRVLNTKDALRKQIAIENQEIVKQREQVKALKAAMHNALINLKLTSVRAPSDGVVDNMYISVGTPINIHKPLFSFIDTSQWWVQANFNETDLRYVRPGDKVTIMLRMYYFNRLFHGVVVNTLWAANRQMTNERTQQQTIINENQWLLLPQRFPIQIKILDPDPRYPLNPGATAYVFVHTRQY